MEHASAITLDERNSDSHIRRYGMVDPAEE